MSLGQKIRQQLADGEILFCDDLDDALIGTVERCGMGPVALYDQEKIVRILMERDNMTRQDAEEFFQFNTLGAFMGEFTPAFATLMTEDDVG